MENEKTKIDLLIDHVEDYFRTRQELSKLIAAEKSSVILSSVITNFIFLLVFSLVFIFASIALAYGIAKYFGEPYAGFLAVALLYLLTGIILFVMKEKWLKTPLANAVIRNFFKTEPHETN
jgi:hypothetical protein